MNLNFINYTNIKFIIINIHRYLIFITTFPNLDLLIEYVVSILVRYLILKVLKVLKFMFYNH